MKNLTPCPQVCRPGQMLAHLIERVHGRQSPWQPPCPQHELLKALLRQRAMLAR